jgi:DNA-binding transcriptional ArsR family regulator
VREVAAGRTDELDPVWKALSDPTRRAILDLLRDRPRTTTGIVESFPHLTRFGVMKHLEVLRQSQLVHTRDAGRQRVNSLNVVPIRQIYERWVGPFQELWSGELLQIKEIAEKQPAGRKSTRTRKKHRAATSGLQPKTLR